MNETLELTEQCRDWAQYDICNEYICPKCYDKRDISTDNDVFVVLRSDFHVTVNSGT